MAFGFPMMNRGNMSGVDMQNLPLLLRYQQMRGGFGPGAMSDQDSQMMGQMTPPPATPPPPPFAPGPPPQISMPQQGPGPNAEAQRRLSQLLGIPETMPSGASGATADQGLPINLFNALRGLAGSQAGPRTAGK